MNRHIDKHLVGALCICVVITASFAFSAFMFSQPAPQVEAAVKSMIAQPYAEGSSTGWIGYPKPSWGVVNIDETITCNSSDYNYTLTASLDKASSTETYRTRLSTIPNTNIVPANDGTGNTIKTSYRIVKIEVTPCLALHLPAPKTSHVDVFYRFAQNASSTLTESVPNAYIVTSNLFKQQTATAWTTNHDKYSDSILEVGVRYTAGDGGARVSQMKVKVSYDTVVETVPKATTTTSMLAPTVIRQTLPTHVLANGDKNLSTFQISSGNVGATTVKQLVFSVSKSSGVTLSNFRIRKAGVDMPRASYAILYATSTEDIDVESGSTGSASGTGYLVISFTNNEETTVSGSDYTVHATVSGATSGKYVRMGFHEKSGVPPIDPDKIVVPPVDPELTEMGDLLWSETLNAL